MLVVSVALLVLVAGVAVDADPQYLGYPNYLALPQYYQPNYYVYPLNHEAAINPGQYSRLFFGGALLNALRPTVTLITTTSTSTATSTFTCTTSTAALSACSPSGRRRRGLVLNNSKGRSLFYADDEEAANEENIFLPSKPEDVSPVEQYVRSSRSAGTPFVAQPGFSAPEQLYAARQLISFATRTVSTTTTTTSTLKLTAICSSTTGYPLC